MGKTLPFSEGQIRRALIAFGEGREFIEIGDILGSTFNPKTTLVKERKRFGLVHGGGVPAAVHKFGLPELPEPAAFGIRRRVRRGFALPKSMEQAYVDLLKSGLSIAEAKSRLMVD